MKIDVQERHYQTGVRGSSCFNAYSLACKCAFNALHPGKAFVVELSWNDPAPVGLLRVWELNDMKEPHKSYIGILDTQTLLKIREYKKSRDDQTLNPYSFEIGFVEKGPKFWF